MALFAALMIERNGRDAAIFFIVVADSSIVCLAGRILADKAQPPIPHSLWIAKEDLSSRVSKSRHGKLSHVR
jgi:hypothetical protein